MNAAADMLATRDFRLVAPLNPSCIVCGEQNPHGLHLHFVTDRDGTRATWKPSEHLQGFRGVVHGGLVTTVLDEAMSKAVIAQGWEALTVELKVRLRARIVPGEDLIARSTVVQKRRREILAEASIHDAEGRERAHAWGKFLVLR